MGYRFRRRVPLRKKSQREFNAQLKREHLQLRREQAQAEVAALHAERQDLLECWRMVFMFEDLHAGVKRIDQLLPTANESRPGWSLGLALASAFAACALVFALASMSRPPEGPDFEVSAAPPLMSLEEVPTDTSMPSEGISLTDTRDGGSVEFLARPLPSKPYKGQKRPPCTPRIEVEIMGGCWVPHELKAPCPEALHEHQGKCYTIAVSAQPPPQSLGQ